ncbi:MerR family transcriptional regulator [Pseudonocardia humida]|uniref:MerR family transcriptional regulator n=1 Tax=Pseudonocardia humida TaxID=2800819 RepID=A0ABT0ZWB1_9PSEU|nr:MerR family transcriptional regulator [Pseudonocardia humida]MCO1655030.1 MerR family transcriptional regulator [Pseudonocardia humida]
MELLTIGAFARACGLSPKALRLYAELGLLTPAVVDERTGYRHYRRDQLEHALLVAWLRRIGMPLARIRLVTGQSRADAAREVAAFWREVEADVAARRPLASFLVDHLTGKGPEMTDTPRPLVLRCAARTDRGLVREQNQDAAHADARIVAVADGFGPSGERASSLAVDTLVDGPPATGDVLGALRLAAERAERSVRLLTADEPDPGSGTTLTALAWSGSELALVHIGDSRAYLLRDGELTRLTHDHTLVQTLIDEGRLSAAEAESHPQRTRLVRALHGGADAAPSRPDSLLQQARAGDRYLLSSDGLHRVLPDDVLRSVLLEPADPEAVLDELVRRVHAAGAPDNVCCALADVVAA